MLFTDSAYQFAFSLASSAILIPYAFSAFYQFKYTLQYDRKSNLQMAIGIIASIYAVWLIYAAGVDYLLLTMLLYVPGLFVYWIVQRNKGIKFITRDYILMGFIVIFAILGLIRLFSGAVSVF